MRVLVAVASRHGGTAQIAEVIAGELSAAHLSAEVCPLGAEPPDPAGYDAVVLGSAAYHGRWLEPALRFAEDHAAALSRRPVWLFTSGPGPVVEPPVGLATLISLTGARDHHLFAGWLDRSALGLAERAVAFARHTPQGDFRDWGAIRRWAETIAADPAVAAATAP